MSDLWLYTPEICDGDYCPMDCNKCYNLRSKTVYINEIVK